VVAAACVLASLTLLVLPAGPRDRTAGAIRGTVVAPLAAMQQRAALARRSFVSHDSLVAIADSIVRRSQRLDELEAENARLRGLLGLGRAMRWGFIPAEALLGRGLGDDHTLLLSAGARAGVERLSGVVSADGLVGMVQHVDATTSVAITWPHPEFRVSATSADGSAFGIVSAHHGEGAEGFLLELRGVPFRQKLAAGTAIVSSGLGGVYPRGIPIGTVMSELGEEGGWERTYLLRPAVRPADVTSVLVLSPARNAAGLESVWAPGRDSALARQP
jgi:rod shape-determining protein MreC